MAPLGQNAGHLAYYEANQISPVRYKGSLEEHFDRRDSVYRSLGLPPAAFRGARVLEVAAGSGQNSIYVAACQPATLDLVEPNATGRQHIEANYSKLDRPHTPPTLHPVRLEDFEAETRFDVVICEGWLGCLPAELDLLRKLGTLVAKGGVLVLTVVPLSGFFPNVMRKLLALRLMPSGSTFEERTQQMVEVFAPHLSTMRSMTRSHEDWVQDCVVNPHYLNVALPFDLVVGVLGDEFEALATFPRFDTDWRWFKSLVGNERDFTERMRASFHRNVLNFIDYRSTFPPIEPAAAAPLETAFAEIHKAALAFQSQSGHGSADTAPIEVALRKVLSELERLDSTFSGAISELISVWSRADLKPEHVRDMTEFAPIFGRETVYTSFTRSRE